MSQLDTKKSDSSDTPEEPIQFDVHEFDGSAVSEKAVQVASPESERDAISEQSVRPEPEAAKPVDIGFKRRYYSPGEVMKKKGRIGCGGMVLALPLLVAAILTLVFVVF